MKQKQNGWCLVVVLFTGLVCCGVAADDWTQWRGNHRDGTWNETGLVEKFGEGSLPVVWRQPLGSGYSGPTVANGRVYVMDRQTEPAQTERVLCFDEKTGKSIWTYEYPATYTNVGYVAGPRASVTIDGGLVYSLGTMGHLACLDAATGNLKWEIDLNETYSIVASKRMPIWGIAASPLIDRDQVIVQVGGDDGASIVSFDKMTGKEKWRSLEDRGQYSSPVLAKQNGKDILICWTGDSVAGLNPLDGSVYWRHEFTPSRMPIGVATPIVRDNKIFVTSFYDGALMLEMQPDSMSVKELWKAMGPNERQTKGLHSIISTPVWIGNYLYGVDSYGELRCLDVNTGERIWESQEAVPKSRWSTIHFVQNGKHTWMFNERGELILAKLSPTGFKEISRAKLIEPTTDQLRQRNGVCWSHPAFANRCVFLRNDEEIVCVNLAADAK